MLQAFKDITFKAKSLALIEQANEIIAEYEAQGFSLTLRQLYYQFVARGFIPNTQKSYKALGSVINDARIAGMISWLSIEDRTRGIEQRSHWNTPKDILESARAGYFIDMWENQPERVEVWIEKEALVGVISGTCQKHDVPYLACRGYVSQSEQWRAYRRIENLFEERGQVTTILHFGDHDPSGIDMTRDNDDRLNLFLNSSGALNVERLALNMEQINKYKPPPNPAKMTDSRFAGYEQAYGTSSWELDALEPKVITKLIDKHVALHRDDDLWAERVAKLKADQATLDDIIDNLE